MANQKVFNVRFQLRNDTEVNWQAKPSFIPLVGEPCVTNDGINKGRIKIGDGQTTWEQLPYVTNAATGQYVTEGELQSILNNYATKSAIESGEITLPVATETVSGAVKSSSAQNNVTVNSDGTLTVNEVSVNKLYQDEGSSLILSGGNANTLSEAI